MKKIGTFYDNETRKEYDLYTMNALKLKDFVLKSYGLSNLKLNMFNLETQLLSDLKSEERFNKLSVNFDSGEILDKETYIDTINQSKYGKSIRTDIIFDAEKGTSNFRNERNEYHHLGYELLPLAISVKNRDMNNLEKVELIDGFKRIFWTKDIPDRDVFVKVYDELTTKEWINAMLLYNSWKIPAGAKSFIDRGFILGLYRHFNFDITLVGTNYLRFLLIYLSNNPYSVLHDNDLFIDDFVLLNDLRKEYCEDSLYSDYSSNTMGHFLDDFAETLRQLRRLEHKLDKRDGAIKIDFEKVKEWMESKEMKKHSKKILSMNVPGFIENYVEKHTRPLLIYFLRGLYKIDGEVNEYCDDYSGDMQGLEGFFIPSDMLKQIKAKRDAHYASIRNNPMLIDD